MLVEFLRIFAMTRQSAFMRIGLNNRKAGFFAVAFLALLTGPAYSQSEHDSKSIVDPDTLPQNRELDRRYHEILNRQPDGKDAHDPWGSVRAAEKPKDDKKHSTTGATSTK
jgi:hypothetical protein